jgi:hypothetical protein
MTAWACDEDEARAQATVGSAHGASGEDDAAYPVAMLWLPDVEAWRGWSMKRVPRQAAPPSARPWRGLVR